MPLTDLPLEELRTRRRSAETPRDLDAFWASTLASSRALATPPTRTAVDSGLRVVTTYDVTFSGFNGEPIRAWLRLPAGATGPLPVVVEYFGYGGGRGLPHEVSFWSLAGYANLQVDTRGQGSGFRSGATPDPHGHGPAAYGFLTQGITNRDDYYYRRVFTDAALAIDAVSTFPEVDPTKIAVAGHSQGGGLALAAASLAPSVRAAMADVPFLCDFPRAMGLVGTFGYGEIVAYLSSHRADDAAVFETLAYFDCAVLVERARANALFSVALMDDICPPSAVFAAFNAYAGEKQIEVYPHNAHEGGGAHHHAKQMAWLAEQW